MDLGMDFATILGKFREHPVLIGNQDIENKQIPAELYKQMIQAKPQNNHIPIDNLRFLNCHQLHQTP
jgi:hypothetical protein